MNAAEVGLSAARAPWDRRDTLTVSGLALACLLLFAWGLGSYPLWDPWETLHAESMLEMTERGDRIMPWLDGKANAAQPILLYWTMIVPTALWGASEFAARLPSALAAVGGVLLLFYCLRRLRGFPTAAVAASVLATTPLYFYMARQAMPDMLLTAFLTGAMGFFALARFTEERRRLHLTLFYASVALAVLAKGPLALAITGGALLVYGLFEADRDSLLVPGTWWRGAQRLAERYQLGLGVLVFFVIAAPWHLALLFRHGPSGFLNSFLVAEGLAYFKQSVGGDGGTAEFYARGLFHGMYPWIGLVPMALLVLFHGKTTIDEDARQKGYVLAWCAAVFMLFTLAGTKQGHYLLPLAPAVAILVALFFEAWFREDTPFWVTPGLLISIPFALLPVRDFLIEGDRYMFRVFSDSQSLDHPGLDTALKIFLGAWVGAILLTAFRRRSWVALGLVAAVAYAHAVYMTQSVLPAQSSGRSLRSYTDLFERVREGDAELLLYGEALYSVHYYFGRERFRHFAAGTAADLAADTVGKPHVYIIAEADELSNLSRALRSSGARWFPIADDHPDYVLLTNSREAVGAR